MSMETYLIWYGLTLLMLIPLVYLYGLTRALGQRLLQWWQNRNLTPPYRPLRPYPRRVVNRRRR